MLFQEYEKKIVIIENWNPILNCADLTKTPSHHIPPNYAIVHFITDK